MRKSPEKLSDNERNPNAGDDGPWGKEYQESVPPFSSKQEELEERQKRIQQREQEYIEKYGPEVDLTIVVNNSRVEQIQKELEAARIKARTPSMSPDGTMWVGDLSEEEVREYESDIKAAEDRYREERAILNEFAISDGIYRNDLLEQLHGHYDFIKSDIESTRYTDEFVSQQKQKLRAINRIIGRVEKTYGIPTPEAFATETDSDDGEMSIDKIPTGEIKEQIETEIKEDQQEESPKSYHIEGGLVDKDATIAVGQEIPDEWFEPRIYGERSNDGFGIEIERPPQIEDYLSEALNIEYGKLPEGERRKYDYSALSKVIKEEARRTKKVPDIISIMDHQRAINEQREKVEQSYGQGSSQQTKEELEDEMPM